MDSNMDYGDIEKLIDQKIAYTTAMSFLYSAISALEDYSAPDTCAAIRSKITVLMIHADVIQQRIDAWHDNNRRG